MLHIAICDDNENQLRQTAEFLNAYLLDHPELNGQIRLFQNGGDLLSEAETSRGFDLYILDILMPDLNGIETGRRLRELDQTGEIIYLTTSNDFAVDSYDVRAFFYLLKPIEEHRLFQTLDRVFEQLKQKKNKAVIVHTADGPQRILLDQILYVERTGRCMRYYCTNETVDSLSIRISFREAANALLKDQRFCLCGASFVLNFQHISRVNGQIALLDNGHTVMLPRTAAADFKKAWGNYWLEKQNIW